MYVFVNRIITIQSPQNEWESIGYRITEEDRIIDIKPIHMRLSDDKKKSIQYNAKIRLKEYPEINENMPIFPKSEIKKLNDVMNHFSHLISIAEVSEMSTSSPLYSKGFICENDDELKFLNKTEGIESGGFEAVLMFKENFFIEINNMEFFDRKDGVKLLSRANSQKDNLSKFRELVRLFENAFGENSIKLARLLNEFLQQSNFFEYQKDEVYEWMTSKRHGATHADLKKTKELVFAEDITFDIERIIQAGYDVLFNKKTWNSDSIERCSISKPRSALTKQGMTIYIPLEEKSITINSNSNPFYALEEKINTDEKFTPTKDWWIKSKPMKSPWKD